MAVGEFKDIDDFMGELASEEGEETALPLPFHS